VLESAGLRGLFDAEVDGVEADRLGLAGKPDPALFLEAARRLGVPPARAAVVEDALAGVEAGRRGRFGAVVGVDRGGQAAALAERGADVVVADLGELALDGAPLRRGGR
jgi:beta-phosphoglucomutase-like phosphatase (HAD superfamily)